MVLLYNKNIIFKQKYRGKTWAYESVVDMQELTTEMPQDATNSKSFWI